MNKRIRELRKQEKKDATLSADLVEGPPADAAGAWREKNTEPAGFETTPPSAEDAERAPSRELERELASPEDIKAIQAGYHANWLPDALRRDLWEYTLNRQPYLVKFRGHDLKTRPKINFADPNEQGEYPLYRWGQERQSYDLVEKIPPPVRFGAKTNLAMTTYYWNGRFHYIPVHNDKKAAKGDSQSHLQPFAWSRQALAHHVLRRSQLGRSAAERRIAGPLPVFFALTHGARPKARE